LLRRFLDRIGAGPDRAGDGREGSCRRRHALNGCGMIKVACARRWNGLSGKTFVRYGGLSDRRFVP
jgi:hypothetical protein